MIEHHCINPADLGLLTVTDDVEQVVDILEVANAQRDDFVPPATGVEKPGAGAR
jgi:hypothetical protein